MERNTKDWDDLRTQKTEKRLKGLSKPGRDDEAIITRSNALM